MPHCAVVANSSGLIATARRHRRSHRGYRMRVWTGHCRPPWAMLKPCIGVHGPPGPPRHSTAAVDDHGHRSRKPAISSAVNREEGPRAWIQEKRRVDLQSPWLRGIVIRRTYLLLFNFCFLQGSRWKIYMSFLWFLQIWMINFENS